MQRCRASIVAARSDSVSGSAMRASTSRTRRSARAAAARPAVVLLSHVLHGYDPDTRAELLTRAAAALAPCGLLVIHEFVPNPAAPAETQLAALFGLEMLLTSSGAAYPAARYREWIEAAGLIHAHHELAPAGPTSAILARSAPQ